MIAVPGPLESLLSAARLRWWIAPLVLSVSVAFMWAQESDLQTSPGYVAYTKSVELGDNLNTLAAVGIQPQAVSSRPSALGQLTVLRSEETRKRLAAMTGGDAEVSVSQSEAQVQFLSAITETDGRDSFTFRFVPDTVFTFSCTEEVRAYCEPMIDSYVAELVSIRKSSIINGLDDLTAVLSGSLSIADSVSVSRVQGQLAALGSLRASLVVDVTTLGTSVVEEGATVTTVRRGSYTFGIVVGLGITLLIWAQLAISDKRIRSRRQLVQRLPEVRVLGELDTQNSSPQFASAAITHAALSNAKVAVRLVPVSGELNVEIADAISKTVVNVDLHTVGPLNTLGVPEILGESASADVLIVKRHADEFDQVAQASAILQNSGRTVLGILLVP